VAAALQCPFCTQDNAPQATVCRACGRDIAVPAALIAERDELVGKRDRAREELARAKSELAAAGRAGKFRSF
jgi:hypothetical protein